MEEVTKTDCYQCREEREKNPAAEIKQAISGPLFPFCSEEHKKIYGDRHYGVRARGSKYHTIEECQKRLEEMRIEKYGIRKEPAEEGRDIYDVAKEIFG